MDSSTQSSSQRYRFDDLTLDIGQYRVWRNEEPVRLAKLTFELLRVLVEAAPNVVTHAELAAKVWGPHRVVTPETLAKRVMLLRRALDDQAEQPRYVEGVRQQGYRLIPAVEAVSTGAPAVTPIARPAASKPALIAVGLGILVLAVVLVTGYPPSKRPDVTPAIPHSIAVLPFVNLSGQKENEYFSDGLAETMLNTLAQNSKLRVVARTSSFAFKNRNMDVREISGELGVAHVLEGSVQRVDDHVRITAQLIRASDGTHLWSEIYDRQLNDIFAIHDEIALAVSSELSKSIVGNANLAVPEGLATKNLEAFDLYLRALPEYAIGSYESMQNAEELLKNALIKDPTFTDARIKLAENYMRQFDTGVIPPATGLSRATALFEQALVERPGNIDARAYLAAIEVHTAIQGGDLGAGIASEKRFREIVEDAPNNLTARYVLARTLRNNSKFEEAIEQHKIAISLDPLNSDPHYSLAVIYVILRDWDAARHELNRSLELRPLQPSIAYKLAMINLSTGKPVDFIREMQKVVEMDPLDHEFTFEIARLLYELGLIDEGDRFRSHVTAIAPASPAAQALRIVRSIRADEEYESMAVARRMIRDNADNRRGAWLRAFRHLMLTAVLRNRTENEFDYINEYVPDFADFGNADISWKVGLARSRTLEIWTELDTDQGLLDRVNHVLSRFAKLEYPVSRAQVVNIDILLLQGDVEAAVDAALADLFSESVLEHLDIKDRFVTPLYADFVADPRIVAELDRWNEEIATMRGEVRQYLALSE